MSGGTYNLGYTTLPTFPTNSIGNIVTSATNSTVNVPSSNGTFFYLIGTTTTSLLLNVGVYMFTSTAHLGNCTGTINLYLTLGSSPGYNNGTQICWSANGTNTGGVVGASCCHIFYVNSNQNFNFTAYIGSTATTLTYSYALCRIA